MVEVLQEKRGLLTKEEVETCKSGMNTWGYVGDLNDHPQLSCVYQSDDAQNEFLSNPKVQYETKHSLKYYSTVDCVRVWHDNGEHALDRIQRHISGHHFAVLSGWCLKRLTCTTISSLQLLVIGVHGIELLSNRSTGCCC